MRILLQCSGLPPMVGGAETIAGNLAFGLGRRGHQVLVVTPSADQKLEQSRLNANVWVVSLPIRQALATRCLELLRKVEMRLASIREMFRADIVHLHDIREGGFLFRQRARHEGARILTLHAPAHEGSATGLAGRLVASAVRIIAVSASQAEDARLRYVPAADKIRVVRNAVPAPDRKEPDAPDSSLFVCVGRLVPEKGFDIALEAFAALRECHPAARLSIVGHGVVGPALAQQAERLGIAAQVSLLGAVDPSAVLEILDQASAVLVPSRWREPFGLVALEAAWRGRPVLASRSGGLGEIVIDGETGFLLPPCDPTSWSTAMSWILDHPREASKLGVAALRRARSEFGFDAFLDAHEAIYAEARTIWEARAL